MPGQSKKKDLTGMGGSEINAKRRSDSIDSPAEKRIHKERIPLEDLVDDRRQLATVAVDTLNWDLVVGMLPEYLKTRSKKEVINLVSDELEGMSTRRINAVLEGDDIPTSSSSDSESSHSNHEDEDSDRYSEEDIERDGSYNSRSPSRSRSSRSRSKSENDDDEEILIYD